MKHTAHEREGHDLYQDTALTDTDYLLRQEKHILDIYSNCGHKNMYGACIFIIRQTNDCLNQKQGELRQ